MYIPYMRLQISPLLIKPFCKEGMAFSVEPGIYLHGRFGIRIEDIVVATANWCETMTKFPKKLTVI